MSRQAATNSVLGPEVGVGFEVSALDEPPDRLLASCMTEAVWLLQLPVAFDEDWASFHVDL